MGKKYITPSIEVIEFDCEDVIVSSVDVQEGSGD